VRRMDPCQWPWRVGDWLGSRWTRTRSYGQDRRSSLTKPTTIKPRTRTPTRGRETRPKAFDTSFKGEGAQVIHFMGDGSVADITRNDNGRIFNLVTLNPKGSHRSILSPRGGWGQIDSGRQFIHIHAAGSWTISIT
jgi:hypothetical protein